MRCEADSGLLATKPFRTSDQPDSISFCSLPMRYIVVYEQGRDPWSRKKDHGCQRRTRVIGVDRYAEITGIMMLVYYVIPSCEPLAASSNLKSGAHQPACGRSRRDKCSYSLY